MANLSEQDTVSALQLMQAITWKVDLETQKVFYSHDKWLNDWPISEVDTVEKWAAHIHPEDRTKREKAIKELWEDGTESSTYEIRFKRSSGGYRWVEIREKSGRRDSQGNLLDITGITIDITQRKEAELVRNRELKELQDEFEMEKEKYKKVFELSGDALSILDLETGKFIECNDSAIKMHGVKSRENFLNLTPDKLSPEFQPNGNRSDELAIERIQKTFTEGFQTFEWVHTRLNGSTFPCLVSLSAIPLEDRQLVLAIGRDISELKKREKELEESEFRWKFAIEGSGDGLWDWNLVDNSVYFSKQWKQILGFEENEIENTFEEWSKRVHPEQLEQVYADVNDHLEGKTNSYRNEHQVLCKDGTYKWVLDRGIIVSRDEEGKPTRMIGVNTDIDEQKTSFQLLSDAKNDIEKIKNIFDKHSILAITDAAGTIQSVNEAFERISGYSEEELLGKNHRILNSGNQPKSYWKAMYDTVMQGNVWHDDVRNINKNGDYYWVDTTIVPLVKNGIIDSYISIRKDITHLKKVEEQLIQAKELAEEANKYKSEFLANMSHEIRTPMTGILGFVEHLRKGESDPQRQKEFDIIKSSGNTLLHIINDILDFSKIESGKLDLESHPVEIHQIITEISSVFKELVETKKINFIRNVEELLPKYFMGDEVRLKQVIFNLISNAIKFTPENGTVTLDAKFNDSKFYLSVTDTGIGIGKEKLQHIFEAFSQEDASTTRKFGGTGLGLTISSNLIKKMGGELKVESEPGEGSKFYFEFSIRIPQKVNSDENEAYQYVENLTLNGKILVVEDNKTNQMLLKFILEDLNAEYDIANDGVEAVKMYQENEYGLILMDENMPNMNGVEATKQIRLFENKKGSTKRTPIVAVTANALTDDRQRFLDAGMDDYLSKPYEEKAMMKIIAKYLS